MTADASSLPFIRSAIRAMRGYTPGEQPRSGSVIKLNTNENPYPPSPRVFAAIQEALTGDQLRKYPDPRGDRFRQAAGQVLGINPDCILIGNGSDELLTILIRALVPEGGLLIAPTPSYILYQTLAQIQGARMVHLPFASDWSLDPGGLCDQHGQLAIVPNPNSPSGTLLDPERFRSWPVPLIVDEAYADFAEVNALSLTQGSNRVIVTRSLSKSYSLAGIRFGFAVAARK